MYICIFVYMYYELIVFLYVGASTFWILYFSDVFKCPKLSILSFVYMFVVD